MSINKCPFTNLPIANYQDHSDSFSYTFPFEGRKTVILCRDCFSESKIKDELFQKNRHIATGLILNKGFKGQTIHWDSKSGDIPDLKKQIVDELFMSSPKEKIDNFLLQLFKVSDYDGKPILIEGNVQNPIWTKYYFKNPEEIEFYISTLKEDGLVKKHPTNTEIRGSNRDLNITLSLTYRGLSHVIQSQHEGKTSNICFVAMSFSEEAKTIRNAIREACTKTNYQTILIDEVHIDSEKTINDEIIANLKKAKFCIADFTQQRDGVYFESGFALGQGKKVIYTCHKDWFEKSHFDTNHFPHIVYESPEELTKKLIDKIEAWI